VAAVTVIEQLERLCEQMTEVDWDFDELVSINTALPDLLALVRVAKRVRVESTGGYYDAVTVVGLEDLQDALEPLFREVPS
jgi:hypothetical protein